MRRDSVKGSLLLIVSLSCFGFSYYVWRQLQSFHASFEYYGLSYDVYSESPEVADTIFNFKFGIAKFLIAGIAAMAVSCWLFLRALKK